MAPNVLEVRVKSKCPRTAAAADAMQPVNKTGLPLKWHRADGTKCSNVQIAERADCPYGLLPKMSRQTH
jgi:hypothetical protein